MSLLRLEKDPSPRFYRVFGASLIATGALFALVIHSAAGTHFAYGLAAAFGVVALIPLLAPRSRAAYLAYVGVSIPAMLVGNVVGTALVTLFFFLVLLPIGLVLRMRKRDPLHLRSDGETLWVESEDSTSEEAYERQF